MFVNRKYMRHPTEVPIEVVQEQGLSRSMKTLHDISYGGLCFDSQTRLRKDFMVRIRMQLSDSVFEVLGQVVWCRKKAGSFEVGITFTGEDEANSVRMVEQICQIEKYRHQILKNEGRKLSSQEAAFEWIKKYAAGFPAVVRFSSMR